MQIGFVLIVSPHDWGSRLDAPRNMSRGNEQIVTDLLLLSKL